MSVTSPLFRVYIPSTNEMLTEGVFVTPDGRAYREGMDCD